ncbi:MAG: DUF2946 family protein [Phycisphaerales bacterium]
MRRLALLLALLAAVGPSSLRWLHEVSAHGDASTREVACSDSHHHDHDADHHGHEGDAPAAPVDTHDCAVCDALATLTPSETPMVALELPSARPCFDTTAPILAARPAPLAALRAMPPPGA